MTNPYLNDSKLVNGRIPAGTTCPYKEGCKTGWCYHKGRSHPIDFSCGTARAFDLDYRLTGKEPKA